MTRLYRKTIVSVLAAAVAVGAVRLLRAQHNPAASFVPSESTWTLAAVGDAIMTRRIAQFDHAADPRFQSMVNVIREADVAMVNLEGSIFRHSEFKGWPEVENGGNWEVGPPEALFDLKAMGFDLFNRANNHTTDYGVEGMRVTDKLLDELGLVHAGTGMNLGQASRPGYFDSPKGRIALIGFATSFTPMSRAGDARPDIIGRPGLNPLRVEQSYEASPQTFQALKTIAADFGPGFGASDERLRLFGATIAPGSANRAVSVVNKSDEERILREVRNAADQSDFVIVTSHTHQGDRQDPPAWQVTFAKRCLDAGAVAFVNHGPHVLRAIEIYKGKPIFYSVADFAFQDETLDPMPSDFYERYALPDTALASELHDLRSNHGTTSFPSRPEIFESVVALSTFQGSRLVDLKLYPIDLARTAPRSQRGTPRLADEAIGQKIIDSLAKLSAPYGTTIVYERGLGVWRSAGAASRSDR